MNDCRKANHVHIDNTTSMSRIDIVMSLNKGGAKMKIGTRSGVPEGRQAIQPACMWTPLLLYVTWLADMVTDHASMKLIGSMWRLVSSSSIAPADQEQQALRRPGILPSLFAGIGQDPAHHRAARTGPAVMALTLR